MIADTFHLQDKKQMIKQAKDTARSKVLDLFEELWAENEKLIESGISMTFEFGVRI